MQPTAIHVQRWQADRLRQEDASGSVISSHQHSAQQDNESLTLEQAWNISPAWIGDLKGEDQATASGNGQLDKLNKQLNQYQALQAKYFIANSSVRDTQVGYWFQLNDHPELEKNHSPKDKEFLILTKHFYNQNNLPKDIKDQIEKLLSLSHWATSKDSDQERQANELTVVRRTIEVVPEYDPLTHRPAAHVQRAKVVSDGEEIHVDEWGRIKVRFLFTRTEDHAHDGGAGSNDTDTDSAWVDVLTPWAGEGYGARFLPRKDEMVVIDFFDGNIDRPFVTGRIHEAQRLPTKFDIKGQLPDTKKLSGIRSKEVGGEGYNQLRFDDTTGQISAQLHSSHGATQLNLGNLSHPKDKAESDGEEIHVDEWGRIKVRFLFTRTEDHAHDGGAGSNDTDTDSAWVDVLTPWAGEGYGARFLPRKDEMVVIDFFDGNIDRPFVTGRIHEAQRLPTKFDIKGQLPDTKKLSGIRSKEVGGEGYNQLRFDDTTGQISAQLHSSHGATQLNLGNLSHPKDKAESDGRGEGFELRTDHAGAIRSKGLYLSTFVQDKATDTHLETKEAIQNFTESLESMKALSEYAVKQKAEAADMLENIDQYIKTIESQWSDLKATKDALMLLASPESISLVSGKDIHMNALDSITVGGGQSINVSTDEQLILNAKKKVSVFAGEDDLKIYAAKGKFDLQSQDNVLDVSARLDVKITSSEGKVEIHSPTEIVFKAKNSALKINGDGVTVITPNKFTAKASQHLFTAGASESPTLPLFPNNICWECLARRAAQRGAFINKGDGM